MEFKTERLILRPWKESDAVSLYEYAKDPEVGPIAGWPVHTSVENSLEVIQNVLSAPETYAVCLKEDNKAIGSVGLFTSAESHTDAKQDEMEIGYWIGVPFWGKGYIPEAVGEMQRHAFEDLGCKGMWCGYYDNNVKSRRCQEKCGFTYHHTVENRPCPLMGDIRTEHFTYLSKEDWENKIRKCKDTVVLYVHGKGGSACEAEHYKSLFSECDVYGFDYKTFTPWETGVEIKKEVQRLKQKYKDIILIANSIGAFFSMNADIEKDIKNAYFISPVVDMEKLIYNMMSWANVTEEELQKKGEIETIFGETLSWKYLTYVKENKRSWNVKTDILYGSTDNLTSLETISEFAKKNKASLTVLDGGEHWFHTKEQMEFLNQWLEEKAGRYEYRSIKPEEADQAVEIEHICFPPNEACSEKCMKERIAKVPDLFLVVVDKETGKLAGLLNGISTNDNIFCDEFFTNIELCDLNGRNVMLLGLDVLPQYRKQGIARELLEQYSKRERKHNRKMLVLTCLEDKVEMYKKLGFTDAGIANSTWGDEEWHEMLKPLTT